MWYGTAGNGTAWGRASDLGGTSWSCCDPFEDEVSGDGEVGERPDTRAIAWTGSDVNGERAHRFCQSDVLRAIPDHPRGGEIEVERLCGGSCHSGHRLSVVARPCELGHGPVRVVWAIEESVDMGPVLCEPLGDVAVDLFHVTHLVEPSGDTGLVGHDRHRHPARLSRAIASAAPSMNSTRSTDPT